MMAFLDNWKDRKGFIIAGGIFMVLAVGVILPIEKSKAITIAEFNYTYLALIFGVVLALYGFLANRIFSALVFMILSGIVSSGIWFLLFSDSFISTIVALWIGFPVGLLVGLIFVILNEVFLERGERKRHKRIKQVVIYLVIMTIFTLMFYKGSDFLEYLAK